MSTAYYPQGMRTMPSGGRMRASLPSQYISWKGSGSFSNPVGIAPSHIRPLTNNDSGNVFLSGSFPNRSFGKGRVFIPRPMKHYRKGRVIPSAIIEPVDPTNEVDVAETKLINYNMRRFVPSAKGQSLSGGSGGGGGLIGDMIDRPGGFIVKQNSPTQLSNVLELDTNCKTCEGVGVIASYYPNNPYLTDNPDTVTQTPMFCCNEEYKAKRRVVYASTILKKNYYTTTKAYLQNRCKTFDQKSFNFKDDAPIVTHDLVLPYNIPPTAIKPGSPLATFNTYVANCYPNAEIYDATETALVTRLLTMLLDKGIITRLQIDNFIEVSQYTFDALFVYLNSLPSNTSVAALDMFVTFINNPYWGVPFAGPSNPNGCKLTVYKPNNPQFAKQGAVSSSTRLLKLNVDTISTNAAALYPKHNNGQVYYQNWGQQLVTANELYRGDDNVVSNLYKNKGQAKCTAPPPALINGRYAFQNKKVCNYQKRLPQYQVPISQPSPYRYYPGTVFSSNHYNQTPRTYVNPSGSA
jgi:hypothetical protein